VRGAVQGVRLFTAGLRLEPQALLDLSRRPQRTRAVPLVARHALVRRRLPLHCCRHLAPPRLRRRLKSQSLPVHLCHVPNGGT